jgi:hypothetical protein
MALGDVTQFSASIRSLNASSDGVHVDGPAFGGKIPFVAGTTQDDMVALTAGTYPQFQDISGDIIGVEVGHLAPNGAKEAFKALAGSGRVVDGVKVGLISGTTANHVAAIGDDTAQAATTGGTYGSIDFGTIEAYPTGASYNVLNIGSPAASRITAKVKHSAGPATVTVNVNGTSTATIGMLDLTGSDFSAGSITQGVILNSSTVTIRKIVLDKVTMTGAFNLLASANGTTDDIILSKSRVAHGSTDGLIQVNAGTIGCITVRDTNGSIGSSGAVIQQNGGVISNAIIAGGNLTGGNAVYKNTTGLTANVTLDNCIIGSFARVCDFYATATLILLNPTLNSISLEPFYTSTGPLTIRGSGLTASGTLLLRAGTEVVNVFCLPFPVDFSQLAKTTNGLATNTNGALACGVGPAVCNGTRWKNLYSGLTY